MTVEEIAATSGADANGRDGLRSLPSVEWLSGQVAGVAHEIAVRAARQAIAAAREHLPDDGRASRVDLIAETRRLAGTALDPSLHRVVNATGVVVHTGLGRAPLAASARAAVARAAQGYSNLEYDLESGRRGSRQAHVEGLIAELTGCEAAIVVNNGAAAVLLAVAALACDREVVVSRGQMVEIGGSFRIPDVVAQSGARLVEVGTTNRTRIADYRAAIGSDTGALLRVHPSNFRSLGFVEEVGVEELCRLGPPVIDDVGAGVLADDVDVLAGEPPLRRSIAAGCAVVCCSGDKLLGGPQAGLLAGRTDAIERCRAHPLARAVRIDKLSLAALEATLRLHLDSGVALREVPTLAMLTSSEEQLHERAQAIVAALPAGVGAEVVASTGKVGGGALPLVELSGPVCAIDPRPLTQDELARRLRRGRPAVAARLCDGRLLLDPRTIADDEISAIGTALAKAFEGDDQPRWS